MDDVGIDVHQKYSQVCEMVEGEVVSRVQVPSTEAWLRRHFEGRARLRILIECGGSSRWVARLLRELEHQVVVLNPRRVRLIAESTLKTDAIDAEILARLAGLGPECSRSTSGAPRPRRCGRGWGFGERWWRRARRC